MKLGDYVRTKQGYIRQIKEIYDHILYYVNLDKAITMERYGEFEPITQLDRDTIDEIIKSSSNIIDLIEVGDYVNGLKVSRVGETYHGRKDKAIYCDYCVDKETGKWTMIYDDEIKSIATKEQFESMEYKVGVDKE